MIATHIYVTGFAITHIQFLSYNIQQILSHYFSIAYEYFKAICNLWIVKIMELYVCEYVEGFRIQSHIQCIMLANGYGQ